MNRNALALTAIATLTAPMVSSAELTIYGRAHLSVDTLNTGTDRALNLSSNSSGLGFKGSHELDYGLQAIFQIEQQINFDTQGSQLASRDTFGGVRGNFGMLRLGKFDTPFKQARGPANLFGDQLGDMRNLTRGTARFDERFTNTIHYRTPNLAGFTIDLAYSTNTDGQGGTDNNDRDAVSAAVGYHSGSLRITAAYERKNDPVNELAALRLAASYDLGALRLVGFAQQADVDTERSDKVYGAGLRYGMGKTGLKGQLLQLDAGTSGADATLIAVGVDRKRATNFTVYAHYALVDNDSNQNLTPYRQARSASPAGAIGETSGGLSLGMIYSF